MKAANAIQKQSPFKPSQFAPSCTEKRLPSHESEVGTSAEKGLWLADCRVSTNAVLKPLTSRALNTKGAGPVNVQDGVYRFLRSFLEIQYFFVCVYCEKESLSQELSSQIRKYIRILVRKA